MNRSGAKKDENSLHSTVANLNAQIVRLRANLSNVEEDLKRRNDDLIDARVQLALKDQKTEDLQAEMENLSIQLRSHSTQKIEEKDQKIKELHLEIGTLRDAIHTGTITVAQVYGPGSTEAFSRIAQEVMNSTPRPLHPSRGPSNEQPLTPAANGRTPVQYQTWKKQVSKNDNKPGKQHQKDDTKTANVGSKSQVAKTNAESESKKQNSATNGTNQSAEKPVDKINGKSVEAQNDDTKSGTLTPGTQSLDKDDKTQIQEQHHAIEPATEPTLKPVVEPAVESEAKSEAKTGAKTDAQPIVDPVAGSATKPSVEPDQTQITQDDSESGQKGKVDPAKKFMIEFNGRGMPIAHEVPQTPSPRAGDRHVHFQDDKGKCRPPKSDFSYEDFTCLHLRTLKPC